MAKYKLLSILLIVSCTALFAQNNKNTISGLVRDGESQEALAYSHISIEGTSKGTASNIDGHFTIFNIEEKNITLVVDYLGYKQKSISITMSEVSEMLIIDLQQAEQTLEMVTVEAGNPTKIMDVGSNGLNMVNLNPKMVRVLPSIGEQDIMRSLQLLPGVSATSENAGGLILRGGTPDQNLMLLDGMSLYHIDHFFGIFSTFHPASIQNIKLIKSGYEAKYGGRVAGVLDLTAKTGNFIKPTGSINVNLLSMSFNVETPLVKEKLSLMVSGRRSYTDVIRTGLYDKLFDQTSSQDEGNQLPNLMGEDIEPKFHYYDFMSKLTWKPTNEDVISLSVYAGKDNLDQSNNSDQSFQGISISDNVVDVNSWGSKGLSAKWSRKWSDKWFTNLSVGISQYKSDYNFSQNNQIIQNEDTTAFGMSSLQKNNVNDISVNFDNEYQWNSNHRTEFGYSFTDNDISFLGSIQDTITFIDRDDKEQLHALYLQHVFTVFRRLHFNTGVRYNWYSGTNKMYFEPRAQLTVDLSYNLRATASGGLYHQFINRVIREDFFSGSHEFWLLTNGEKIDVLESEHMNFGLIYEKDNLMVGAEYFKKNTDNVLEYSFRFGEIDTEDSEGNDELFQSGKAYVDGFEVYASHQLGPLQNMLAYTYSTVDYEFENINNGNRYPASHDQRHELKLTSVFVSPRWDLATNIVYASGKPYTSPVGYYSVSLLAGNDKAFVAVDDKNNARLPNYSRVDVSATYKFVIGNSDCRLGLSVYNLLNHENVKSKKYSYEYFDYSTFKEYDPPRLKENNVTLLGFTPNLSFEINF